MLSSAPVDPLPSLDEYLGRLPHGVDSYPEAMIKGSVLLSIFQHPAFADLMRHERVPAGPRRLLTEPPTATSWVPEVHFNTLVAAFYDVAFASCGGFPAYELWVADQNTKLFRAPLYRILFVLISPERLLGATASRWSLFRRGSTLETTAPSKHVAEITLTTPAHLEPVAMLHGLSGAFRAAVRAAGGSVTAIEWVALSPTVTRWTLNWR